MLNYYLNSIIRINYTERMNWNVLYNMDSCKYNHGNILSKRITIIQVDNIKVLKINTFSGSRCTYLPKTDNEL